MDSSQMLNEIDSIRVKEIMIPVDRYPQVTPESTLRAAIKLMGETRLDVNGCTSLPRALLVFNEDSDFKGCVRRRDIMGGLEPKFLVSEPIHYRMKLFNVNLDPNLSALCNKHVVKGIQEQADRPVSDVMRPIEASLNPNDFLMTAMYEMVVYNLNLIPVVSQKKVTGVVRSVELFQKLAEMVL